MSLAIPHQFRKHESPVSSTKVNENNSVIVSYINDLETSLLAGIYDLIPVGTKMVFYQAAAPTGWTLVTGIADKFLRIVSGGGGSTGGTMAASTDLTHSHTMAHTHDLANHTHVSPNHEHLFYSSGYSGDTGFYYDIAENVAFFSDTPGSVIRGITAGATNLPLYHSKTQNSGSGTTGNPSSNTSGGSSASNTATQFTGNFAYADVIVGEKD